MLNLGISEALQYQKDIKSGKIKLDPKPGKNYLDQFIKNRIITPAAGAVDFLTTGTLNTDLDKKGDSGFQTDVKNVLQKTKERIRMMSKQSEQEFKKRADDMLKDNIKNNPVFQENIDRLIEKNKFELQE